MRSLRKRTCGLLLPIALLPLAVPAPRRAPDPVQVTREVYLMGTRCTLTAYAPDREHGIAKLESLVRSLEAAETELSTWRENTTLSRLNRQPAGESFALPEGLCRIWEDLLYWSRESGGAFDPAIGCLVEAWGLRTGGRIPSQAELDSCREHCGLYRFRYDRQDCTLVRRTETWIDSGAFGKGAALDRALAEDPEDRRPWLIDLGGQVMVHGTPPGGVAWPVAVARPEDRRRPALEIRIASGSLATSGGSERDLHAEGGRVGHILDPRSGRAAPFAGSVTVWHERALAADILSTALFVMGPGPGLAWARDRGIAVCYLQLDQRAAGGLDILASPAFERCFLSGSEGGRQSGPSLPAGARPY